MAEIVDTGFSEEMLERKMNRIFTWWDQNGDGWVTEDDVEKITNGFTGLADDKDEKNKSLMHQGMFNWWHLMLESRDNKTSNRLRKQEFIRAMRSFRDNPSKFRAALGVVIDGMLGALDRNKDGVLSLEEYMEVYKGVGLTRDIGAKAFHRLDRDGDGVIDHQEFEEAIYEYYLSPDPNAPGQWLFGPPQDL